MQNVVILANNLEFRKLQPKKKLSPLISNESNTDYLKGYPFLSSPIDDLKFEKEKVIEFI